MHSIFLLPTDVYAGDFRTASFFTIVGPVDQEIILIFSARAFLV
jgi:hypothetical protein